MGQNEEDDKFSQFEGKKFRFVVKSAEEAVGIIKNQLGPNAKVLEVNQVGGKGLARFLSSPNLEIIATVLKSDEKIDKSVLPQLSDDKKTDKDQEFHKSIEKKAKFEESSKLSEKKANDHQNSENSEKQRINETSNLNTQKFEQKTNISNILKKVGFDNSLVESMKNEHQNNENISIAHSLLQFSDSLRKEYKKIPKLQPTLRIAFIGTPGTGKTTALCKKISKAVFLENKSVQVVKLDSDLPNVGDALKLFCDVLGVQILRGDVDIDKIDSKKQIYIDLPGISGSQEIIENVNKQLDNLLVDTRIWVVNSAYDTETLNASFELAEKFKSTHVVYTHLDETINCAKLWKYFLRSKLSTFFMTSGQNLTGGIIEEPEEFLISKSFPKLSYDV